MTYILIFLVGVLAANGMPHFIKGVTGERHMTPFGKPSHPVINVVWGVLNLCLATLVAQILVSDNTFNATAATFCFFAGVLVTGVFLALLWQNDPKARGKKSHEH